MDCQIARPYRRRPVPLLAVVLSICTATAAVLTGLAGPAQAAVSLTLTPSSATSIKTFPIDVTASASMSSGTYGLAVGGTDPAKPLKVVVTAADNDTKKSLGVAKIKAGSFPFENALWVAPPVRNSATGATGTTVDPSPADEYIYYLSTKTPGNYSVIFYQEGDAGSQSSYDPADDASAATIAVLSYDFGNLTPPTADDGQAAIDTGASPQVPGTAVNATITLPELSVVDVRGVNAITQQGVLGMALTGGNRVGGPVGLTTVRGHDPRVHHAKLDFDSLSTDNNGVQHTVYKSTFPPGTFIGRLAETATMGLGGKVSTHIDYGTLVSIRGPLNGAGGGEKVQLRGTADPSHRVDIYIENYGEGFKPLGYKLAASKITNPDGSFSLGTTPTSTFAFYADVNGKIAHGGDYQDDPGRVDVYSGPITKAKALGGGRVRFTMDGKPDVQGFLNVYANDIRIVHVKSNKKGDAVVDVQYTRGNKTFYAYFQAPGLLLGSGAQVKLRVT